MQKRPDKVFCTYGLYENELEKLLSKHAESKVANLLFGKIIDAEDKIVLSRNEIALLKKFFVIEQLRTPDAIEYIAKEREDFRGQSSECLLECGYFENQTSALSNEDYLSRTLRNLLEYEGSSADDLLEWLQKPTTTLVAQKWLRIFNSCYIAFWDSKKSGEDFLITDEGMACEQDPSALPPFGLSATEHLKLGFLASVRDNPCLSKTQIIQAAKLAYNRAGIRANFYLFSLTATRTIALIDPFFRTYDSEDQWQSLFHLPSPDFWPSAFLDKGVARKNKVVCNGPENQYIYPVHDMQLEDVIYYNTLLLDRINNLLGFGESQKIIRSIAAYLQIKNPRKDYRGLKKELEKNGYSIPESQKYKDMAHGFATRPFLEISKGLEYIEYVQRSLQKAGK